MWSSLITGDSADESFMSMSNKEDLRRMFFGVEVSHHCNLRHYCPASLVVSRKFMLAALDFVDIMHTWIDNKAHLYKWSSPFFAKDIVLQNMPIIVYSVFLNVLDMGYKILAC